MNASISGRAPLVWQEEGRNSTKDFVEVLEIELDLARALGSAVVAYVTEFGEEPEEEAVVDMIDDAYRPFLPAGHFSLARSIAESVDAGSVVQWLEEHGFLQA